ncbi:MAG: Arabinofuranosyltransferase [Myxococcaceae bacterium]|nr:Arabinofuranosyltransferase [Myxococcaceae bacterium]
MQPAQVAPVVQPKWLAIGALAVLLGLVLRSAWVTEDAYITLRTVDNWVGGFGLRWNTDERVQSYTHPLWMMLLSAAYYVTRESFGTTIFVGMATTFAALLVLLHSARTAVHGAAATILLTFSLAFVEFSTSGLENPLTHLLLAVFVYQYAVRRDDDLPKVALTAALIALTRVDALLAVLPALLHVIGASWSKHGARRLVRDLALGFSPLIAWECFSLFYYGFLVPNTAYAKLNTGLPRNELMRQGLTYLLNASCWDPPLVVITGMGVGAALIGRRPREQLLALGAVLYVFYVVWIGGDFMVGRFLTLPLFLAVCLFAISELPLEDPARAAVVVLPLAFFFWHPAATEKYPVGDFMHSGVADERSYYRDSQLMLFTRLHSLPAHIWVAKGRDARARNLQGEIFDNVGFFGFFAGPNIHIIDQLALTEPLLARLPATYSPTWRVGHYSRHIPEGFVKTVTSGTCAMEDKNLCEYYTKLREVTAGDLWSWSRLKTIARFNLGSYDYLIDRERYRYPGLAHESLQNLQAPTRDGEGWKAPGMHPFTADGIAIDLGKLTHASKLLVALDGNDDYSIEFRKGSTLIDTVLSPDLGRGLMHVRTINAPKKAVREGYDSVLVRPGEGDGMYSIGQLRLSK